MENLYILSLILLLALMLVSCNGIQDSETKYKKIELEIPDRIDVICWDNISSEDGKTYYPVIRTINSPEEIAALIAEINEQPCKPKKEDSWLIGNLNLIKDGRQYASIIVASSDTYSIQIGETFSPQPIEQGSLMQKIQQNLLDYHKKIEQEWEEKHKE